MMRAAADSVVEDIVRAWNRLLQWIDTTPGGKFATVVFLVALGLRVLSVLGLWYFSMAAGRRGFAVVGYDAYHYDQGAWVVARYLRAGRWPDVVALMGQDRGNILYFYVLGFLYAAIGHVPLAGRMLGALAGAAVPLLTWGIGREVFDETTGRRAAVFTAVFPNLIYWSAYDLLKDPLAWVLLLASVYAALRIARGRWLAVWVLPVCLLGLRLCRGPFGLYVLVAIGVFLVAAAFVKREHIAQLLVCLALVAAVEVLLAGGLSLGQWFSWQVHSTGGVAVVARGSGEGANAVGEGANAITLAQALTNPVASAPAVAKGFVMFLLGPFAWVIPPHFVYDSLLFPGMWMWYGLFPFSILGMYLALRRPSLPRLLLLIITIEILLGYGLYYGAGNFRQREQVTPLLAILGVVGIDSDISRRFVWLWYGGVGLVMVGHTLGRSGVLGPVGRSVLAAIGIS